MYRFHLEERARGARARTSYSGRISRSRVSRASPAADTRSACTLVEEEEEEAEEKGGGEGEEEEEVARSRVNEPREDEKDVTHPFNRETLWFLISDAASKLSRARCIFHKPSR